MTGMMPLIELLEDCETDAQRAQWLLRAPGFVFYRDLSTILRVLRNAGFLKGVEYAEAEHSLLVSTRGADGHHRAATVATVNAMRAFMHTLVRKGGLE